MILGHTSYGRRGTKAQAHENYLHVQGIHNKYLVNMSPYSNLMLFWHTLPGFYIIIIITTALCLLAFIILYVAIGSNMSQILLVSAQ